MTMNYEEKPKKIFEKILFKKCFDFKRKHLVSPEKLFELINESMGASVTSKIEFEIIYKENKNIQKSTLTLFFFKNHSSFEVVNADIKSIFHHQQPSGTTNKLLRKNSQKKMGKNPKKINDNYTFRNKVNVYNCAIDHENDTFREEELNGISQILKNILLLIKFKSVISKPKSTASSILAPNIGIKQPIEISTKASTFNEVPKVV